MKRNTSVRSTRWVRVALGALWIQACGADGPDAADAGRPGAAVDAARRSSPDGTVASDAPSFPLSDGAADAGVDVGIDGGGQASADVAPPDAITAQGSLRFRTVAIHNLNLGEGIAHGDFNRDQKMDVVSGPYWWQGPAFTSRHEYFERPAVVGLRDGTVNDWANHAADFDGDGWTDVVTVNRPGTPSYWYKNPGAPQVETPTSRWRRSSIGKLGPEQFPFADVSGDGKPDLLCAMNDILGFLNPAAGWTFTRIAGTGPWSGLFEHGLGLGDVDKDGRLDVLEPSGWWGRGAGATGAWTKRNATFSGPGGGHMYAYDIDGDGDNDVVSSLDAHGWGLAWFEQERMPGQTEIRWKRHMLVGTDKEKDSYGGIAFSQIHALVIHDMDGDGLVDIVTGKSFYAHPPGSGDPDADGAPVIYIFRLTRTAAGVKFVPHLVDSKIGLGRQFDVGDVSGDGLPDILVGNKKGVHLFIQEPR